MSIRFTDMRDVTAALIAAAIEALAAIDPGPAFTEYVGRSGWRRSSQETLVLARQEVWQHPIALSSYGWWDRLPEMEGFRDTLASHPELRDRVDSLVGFPFSLNQRPLLQMLIAELLTPLVETTRTYSFDRVAFDARYAAVEAGLLADTLRLVQAVPLLGFDKVQQLDVRLPGDLVVRLMTETELSAAVQLGLPDQAPIGPMTRTVSRLNQYALVKLSTHAIQVGSPADPVTAPTPIDDDARRLQMALRLVCGGSVTIGRSFQMQHPDDFDANSGFSGSLSKVDLPDENRATVLYTPDQLAQVKEMMMLLTDPAVTGNRPLQMAMRRFVSAGSRDLAEDRLVDLTVGAEALFIHAAGLGRTKKKKDPIANGAATLLGDDPELGASTSAITEFISGTYNRRNHEVHADPGLPPTAILLNGTPAPSINAIVEDLERLMCRAITLTMQRESTQRGVEQ